MASRAGRRMLATVFTLVLLAAPGALHAQFNKSVGKIVPGTGDKKTFVFDALNAGLCTSQPKPTLVIFPDGHQDFNAQVRSNGAKDTFQAYVRYFAATGAFLYEVKWWQHEMEKPGIWSAWKVTTKADPDLAKKLKEIRKVTVNYKC